MITVLVTGVGGPLGQAILKAVSKSRLQCRTVGTDRFRESVGLHWTDATAVIPDCSDENAYIDALIAVCKKEGVQIVFAGSDSELRLLSRRREQVEKETGCIVIAPALDILDTALDKLETCRFLEKQGLAFPAYARMENEAEVSALVEKFGYPLIAKPCKGSGSQGLFRIRNFEDIRYVRTLPKAYVLQELLLPDDQEFTVASTTSRSGKQMGSICMRRELAAGNTYKAWVVDQPVVQAEAMRVVAALGIRGPCNVQLRLTARGPVTFEINPRLSGTTAMRAQFGYNEVEMAIRSFLLGEELEMPTIIYGTALRFWDEFYPPIEQHTGS